MTLCTTLLAMNSPSDFATHSVSEVSADSDYHVCSNMIINIHQRTLLYIKLYYNYKLKLESPLHTQTKLTESFKNASNKTSTNNTLPRQLSPLEKLTNNILNIASAVVAKLSMHGIISA